MDKNIRPCEHCYISTSFERHHIADPYEGQVCDICDEWCCNDCIDWSMCTDGFTICKNCVQEKNNES